MVVINPFCGTNGVYRLHSLPTLMYYLFIIAQICNVNYACACPIKLVGAKAIKFKIHYYICLGLDP